MTETLEMIKKANSDFLNGYTTMKVMQRSILKIVKNFAQRNGMSLEEAKAILNKK